MISAEQVKQTCGEKGMTLESYFVELLVRNREANRHGKADS